MFFLHDYYVSQLALLIPSCLYNSFYYFYYYYYSIIPTIYYSYPSTIPRVHYIHFAVCSVVHNVCVCTDTHNIWMYTDDIWLYEQMWYRHTPIIICDLWA